MKIRIAKTAGFCMGVRRAVDLVLDLQRSNPPLPIVTYGPLIHNPQTLELLRSMGVNEVSSIDEVSTGTVVIRAHGISPAEKAELKSKGIALIDATCPRVSRVQAVIKKHAAKDQFCVIVGDEDHPEVRGLMGFAVAGGIAIESEHADFSKIPVDGEICVVAQTTQEIDTFDKVVENLRKINPKLNVFNTICDSTRRRQEEVSRLAKSVDLVVVVGGKGSGNTQRLLKVAQSQGVRAIHVETDNELPIGELTTIDNVGVTAGASTPNWQIRRIIERLKQVGMSRNRYRTLRVIADTSIMTYGWAAAAGAGLTAASLKLMGMPITLLPMLVTALFVFSMHLLNRIQERSGAVRFNTPEIAAFYANHRILLSGLGWSSSLLAVLLSSSMGIASCLLLVAMLITGRLYTVPLARRLPGNIRWLSLKDLPGSKTPIVALGWASCAVILPVSANPEYLGFSTVLVFSFAAGVVFWRTALSDLLDIQGDRIVGRETIPILIGVKNTRKLLSLLLLILAGILVFAVLIGIFPEGSFLLLLNLAVFFGFFSIYRRRHLVDRLLFEAVMDGNIVLMGLLSLL